MLRELPKNFPIAMKFAVETTLKEGERIDGNRSVAESAYREHRRLAFLDRDVADMRPMADAIMSWSLMARSNLRIEELCARFQPKASDAASISLSFFCNELRLENQPTAPDGVLKVELTLEVDPDPGMLIRYHEWFEGYRMAGGGIVFSSQTLALSFFPAMLRALHAHVAEGSAWERLEYSLRQLPKVLKDR